jgi:hypothetical protein
MDEVFDLKQKNMWFRSRFVSILKRFLRAFMGDSVNRYGLLSIYFSVRLIFLLIDELQCLFNIGHQQKRLQKKFYGLSTETIPLTRNTRNSFLERIFGHLVFKLIKHLNAMQVFVILLKCYVKLNYSVLSQVNIL